MTCPLCGSADVGPLPFAVPAAAGRWARCRGCGSDACGEPYDPGLYGPTMSRALVALTGGDAACREAVRSNCEWFGHHADPRMPRSFLDVGCGDGAALAVMGGLGWAACGWDVVAPHYGGAVAVSPHFVRWAFPARFAAVLSRESVEHCPTPQLLLHELHGACLPGGLVQVQTPRPAAAYHPNVYQPGHLFVASPAQLKAMLAAAWLDVIDERSWGVPAEPGRPPGQAYLCRARR